MPGTQKRTQAAQSRDRLRENTQAGGKHARARSNRACCGRELNNTGIRTFLVYVHCRAILDQGTRFFAYSTLIIHFKGVLMKLKIVALAISIAYFYDFFYV